MSAKATARWLLYLGVPVAMALFPNATVRAVLAILYLMAIVPFGLLELIDLYRSNTGASRKARIFNAMFRLPLALLGLLCLVVGASIIGWVLYNVLIERQEGYSGPKFLFPPAAFGIAVPMMLYGLATLRSVLFRSSSRSGNDAGPD